MKQLYALSIAAVILLSASIVKAQPGGGQGPGGFGGGPFGGGSGAFGGGFGSDPTLLLSMEPVQKELAISDEQKADLQKLSEEGTSLFADFRNLSREERTKKLEERTAANKKRVAEILLPPQMGRLEEISIQIAGAGALDRADVAEKLKLSDSQKQSLKDIAKESQSKMGEMFSGGPGAMGDIQEKMAAAAKDRKEKALAVLTKEQLEKFDGMQGKKFELDLSQMTLRFGGPRGNRGPGGGFGAPGGTPASGSPAGGAPAGGNQPTEGN